MTEDEQRAAGEALAVAELLEIIILHLPMQTIFVVQRVCQAWKAMISTSVSIRKKIFMLATSSVVNPTERRDDLDDHLRYDTYLEMNPVLQTKCLLWGGLEGKIADCWVEPPEEQCFDCEFWRFAPSAVRAAWVREASWENMYASNPPCSALLLVDWCDSQDDCLLAEKSERLVTNENGVRLGDLEDAVAEIESMCRRKHVGRLMLRCDLEMPAPPAYIKARAEQMKLWKEKDESGYNGVDEDDGKEAHPEIETRDWHPDRWSICASHDCNCRSRLSRGGYHGWRCFCRC